MAISELELNVAIVETNTKFLYAIVNKTPFLSAYDENNQEFGVFSTSDIIDKIQPLWKENPQEWMVWRPQGASNAVFIERTTVKALENLASKFLLQPRWHPETKVPNIASFGTYDIKHQHLLEPLHA
jgi:hypothetical protein